jgi:hypothetical protein
MQFTHRNTHILLPQTVLDLKMLPTTEVMTAMGTFELNCTLKQINRGLTTDGAVMKQLYAKQVSQGLQVFP